MNNHHFFFFFQTLHKQKISLYIVLQTNNARITIHFLNFIGTASQIKCNIIKMTQENFLIFVFPVLWVVILHILFEPFIFTERQLKENVIIFWVILKITVRLIFHCPEECLVI